LLLCPTVSLPIGPGVGHPFGSMTRFYFFLSFAGQLLCSSSWGALSDERTGLQFAVKSLNGPGLAEPVTIL
jgi:hypothetical protein